LAARKETQFDVNSDNIFKIHSNTTLNTSIVKGHCW